MKPVEHKSNRKHAYVNLLSRRAVCRNLFWLLAGWHLLGPTRFGFSQQPPVEPARSGLDDQRQMQISPEDRCPVCGMKPVRYPKFSSAIQLDDRRTFYFCSNGCMLRTWLHPEIFLAVSQERISLAVVRDYFSGRQIEAGTVFWIAGSDVIGPMGPAMVAVEGDQSVKAFLSRHGGRRVFRLQELTDELWFSLTGRSPGLK